MRPHPIDIRPAAVAIDFATGLPLSAPLPPYFHADELRALRGMLDGNPALFGDGGPVAARLLAEVELYRGLRPVPGVVRHSNPYADAVQRAAENLDARAVVAPGRVLPWLTEEEARDLLAAVRAKVDADAEEVKEAEHDAEEARKEHDDMEHERDAAITRAAEAEAQAEVLRAKVDEHAGILETARQENALVVAALEATIADFRTELALRDGR